MNDTNEEELKPKGEEDIPEVVAEDNPDDIEEDDIETDNPLNIPPEDEGDDDGTGDTE